MAVIFAPSVELDTQAIARLHIVDDGFPKQVDWWASELSLWCESPIEVMLGVALLAYTWFPGMWVHPIVFHTCDQDELSRCLVPQFQWKAYRMDWMLRHGSHRYFIECDGHEFHERTKEQAKRDHQKDMDVQAAGIPILRFTGSEIYENPSRVASAIINFAINHEHPEFTDG